MPISLNLCKMHDLTIVYLIVCSLCVVIAKGNEATVVTSNVPSPTMVTTLKDNSTHEVTKPTTVTTLTTANGDFPPPPKPTIEPKHPDAVITSTSTSTTTTTTATPSTSPTTTTKVPATTTTSPPSTSPTTTTTTAKHLNPTASSKISNRHFDGPSFIGGIIFALGLMGIGFVVFRFYKARTEQNYHTL